MKIVIEVEDSVLRRAVESQVGEAIAKHTQQSIKDIADKVIATKLERFDPVDVAERKVRESVQASIESALTRVLGRGWDGKEAARKLVQEAVIKALKSAV